MHFIAAIIRLLAHWGILCSSLRNKYHSDIKEEHNHRNDAVGKDSTTRDPFAAHGSGLQETKTSIDHPSQYDNTPKPLMEGTECASSSSSVVE